MRACALLVGVCALLLPAGAVHAAWDVVVFRDDFSQPNGSQPDPAKWVINHPGSYWWVQGRSHFPEPTTPGAVLPYIEDGAAVLEQHLYNALDGGHNTFVGGEISTRGLHTFEPTRAYRFEARVKIDAQPDGLVTSFFTYGFDGTNSDEIDYEFVSRQFHDDTQWPPAGGDPAITNPWNEGFDHPQWAQVPGLSLTDDQWDTFVMYWDPVQGRVEWWWDDPVNGETWLRTETNVFYIPDQPMDLYFNFWAPPENSVWNPPPPLPVGSPGLQPVDDAGDNMIFTYRIDYAEVRAHVPGDTDLDGDVDLDDYNELSGHMYAGVSGGYGDGDFDGDGDVDFEDFVIQALNFGKWPAAEETVGPIPEPAAALLFIGVFASTGVLRRRR